MNTRKRTLDWNSENQARRLRMTSSREGRFPMPISMRFNMFLFMKEYRQAFQVDGRFASFFKEDMEDSGRGYNSNQLKTFLMNVCSFTDIVVHDYQYGILVTREQTLKQYGHSYDKFKELNYTAQEEIIGKCLNIRCSIKNWDLQNNHQIAIQVNNEDLIVYMCNEKDISKVYKDAIEDFEKYRTLAETYNNSINDEDNSIFSIELTFRCRTTQGGRYRKETRKEYEFFKRMDLNL